MHALDCLGVDPFTVRRFVVFFSCHWLIYSFLELQTINDVFFLSLSSVSFVHHPSSLSSSISFISSTLLITFLLVPRHFLSSSTYTRAHSHYPLPTILHYWSTILPPSITIPFHIPFHHPSPSTTPFHHHHSTTTILPFHATTTTSHHSTTPLPTPSTSFEFGSHI